MGRLYKYNPSDEGGKLRTKLSLLVLIMMINHLMAITIWDEPVTLQQNVNPILGKSSVSTEQGVISVWSDIRNEKRKLYAQLTTENGQHLWPEGGIELSTRDWLQSQPCLIESSDGHFIVIWPENPYIEEESSSDSLYYCAQKIDNNGNLLWGEAGKIVCAKGQTSDYYYSRVFPDQSGGFFIIVDRMSRTIRHINANGETIANFTVFPEGLTNGLLREVYYTSQDDFILVYNESYQRKIVRCSNTGQITSIPQDLNDSNAAYYFSLKEFDNHQVICVWKNGNNIYGQIINPDGSVVFSSGGKLIIAETHLEGVSEIMISENNLYVKYCDRIMPVAFKLIKTNHNLDLLWSYQPPFINNLTMLQRDTDHIYLFNIYNGNITGQKLDSSGNALWEPDGHTICSMDSGNIYIFKGHNQAFVISSSDYYSYELNLNFFNTQDQLVYTNNQPVIFQGYLGGSVRYLKSFNSGDMTFYIWEDYNCGKLSVQLINHQNREILWPGTARQYTDVRKNSIFINAKTDSQGRLHLFWFEKEGNECTFKTQLIDNSGHFFYPENGLVLWVTYYNTLPSNFRGQICIDGNNSYFYFSNPEQPIILGQRVLNGNIMWESTGRIMFQNEAGCQLTEHNLNDHLLVWEYGDQLKVLKLDQNGSAQSGWQAEGLTLMSFNPEDQDFSKVFLYKDETEYVLVTLGFFYQIITDSGHLIFPSVLSLIPYYYHSEDDGIFWDNGLIIYYYSGTCHRKRIYTYSNYNFIPQTNSPSDILIQPVEYQIATAFKPMHYRTLYAYREGQKHFAVMGDLTETMLGTPQEISNSLYNKPISVFMNKINNSNALVSWVEVESSIKVQKVSTRDFTEADHIIENSKEELSASNYPNPFNPSTKISYTLKNNGQTELSIYNIKGQKVATLVNDEMSTGTHEVIWNGKDEQGKNVSSGLYFYRLESGTTSLTKKMILMK